jgi:hypothetical protein
MRVVCRVWSRSHTQSRQRNVLLRVARADSQVCKVLVLPVTDMSSTFGESAYVDVRAKRKPERTPERVSELSAQVRTLGLTRLLALC